MSFGTKNPTKHMCELSNLFASEAFSRFTCFIRITFPNFLKTRKSMAIASNKQNEYRNGLKQLKSV